MTWRFVGLLLFANTSVVIAQPTRPFSTITVGAGAVSFASIGSLREFYERAAGAELVIETPIEFGAMSAAVARQRLTGKDPAQQKNFVATTRAIAWWAPRVGVRALSMNAGVRIADFRMDFDDPDIVEGLRDERELMLSVAGRATLRATKRLRLDLSLTRSRLMLHHPVLFTSVGAGAAYTFDSPSWLEAFLR